MRRGEAGPSTAAPTVARLGICLLAFSAFLVAQCSSLGAKLDAFEFESLLLKSNPLGDPAKRLAVVFSPDGTSPSTPTLLVLYLPGWGLSSRHSSTAGPEGWLGRVVDLLKKEGIALRIAVPDCRSRYGGSQYIDSTATGAYGSYLVQELIPRLRARYAFSPDSGGWIAAGHSSGGYGALMLAMNNQALFHGIVALSPDTDFEATHRGLAQRTSVRVVTAAELELAMSPAAEARLPSDGLACLMMGLCANYAPSHSAPGRFEWLYDSRQQWRPEVWQRWLTCDPCVIAKTRDHAFRAEQRLYLDGAEHDEYLANIGARNLSLILKSKGNACTFIESKGGHADRLPERLAAGLRWLAMQK